MPAAKKNATLEINPAFQRALDLIETGQSVFITGRAGTGKSTLLKYFLAHAERNIAVVAPTGVAALNVSGQTIHSFFGFRPDVTPGAIKKKKIQDDENVYRQLDTLVIDEISMVRADLLDCIEKFLRLHGPQPGQPFGGVQLVAIGDLYQLPPVVGRDEAEIFRTQYETPYFFSAKSFGELPLEFVELEKIYRQRDDDFIRLLNAIRNNSVTPADLTWLNGRYDPVFEAPTGSHYIYLTTTNAAADEVNARELMKLQGREYAATGYVEGDFGKEYLPTAPELAFKMGAQVMLLTNDGGGRWVNGTIARITDCEIQDDAVAAVLVDLPDGQRARLTPFTWEIFRYTTKKGKLVSNPVGTFTQFPFRLAFAVTIHKSQGKTFDRVVLDLGRGTFAHGQLYVALSRCTTFEGLVLKTEVKKQHVRLDYAVARFLTNFQYQLAARALPHAEKMSRIEEAIKTKQTLTMVYLKGKDEKSTRTIQPLTVGPMEYAGKPFTGVTAHCLLRGGTRVFNVERILELTIAP